MIEITNTQWWQVPIGDSGRTRCLRQFDLVLERSATVFPRVEKDQVDIAARDAKAMAVRRESSTVECAILDERLCDLPRLQIDDLNALLAPAAKTESYRQWRGLRGRRQESLAGRG